MTDKKLLGHLRSAQLACLWIDQLDGIARSFPTDDEEFNEELYLTLGVAQANLLRWRAVVGGQHGLIEKNEP